MNTFPQAFKFTETNCSPSKKLSGLSGIGSLLELLLNECDLSSFARVRFAGNFLCPTCLDAGSSEDERLCPVPPIPLFIEDVTDIESLYKII